MATAGADKKKQTWSLNDKFNVSVARNNPAYIDANVELQCFATDKPKAELKGVCKARKTVVQFPVLHKSQSHSTDILKETFRKCVINYVTKDLNFVLIPIDDVKFWTKKEFCEVILEEIIALAGNQKTKLNHPVKLEFCTMEDHNFGEAVKACEAKIKDVKKKQVVQKGRKSGGPSICIVKDSLENVKVDAIACTTSQDFNLSRGAVSAALLRRGGQELQRDLYNKCGGKNMGEVIPVPGHKLNCRVVFFGVMYPYDPKHVKGYKSIDDYFHSSVHDFMQRCKYLAEKNQLRSIAFPAIGAGNLKYPLDIVAEEMFRTVCDWQVTFVKDVKFVIYPKDTVVLQEFERALKKYVPSSEIRHSGSIGTSQFFIPNPDSQVGSSKVKCRFPLPKGYTTEFIEMCCADVIDRLKKSDCDVSFTKDELIIKFASEVCAIGKSEITDALKDMEKEYPTYDFLDLTQTKFNQNEVRKKVEEIEKSSKVKCSVSNNGTSVSFFGKIVQDVKDAKDKFFSFLMPPRGHSEQNSQKDTKDAGSKQKTPGFSRQFSWSTRAKELRVYGTKEKITVKVYSSDILCVPVDCIVNAANVDLKHGGGIARAIADAAGKDLNKEGRDYLKQHGKLRVGEVCHTGAGKMSYNYVIHAVGPCWSDYKPYSLRDVERCEADLYNAVINSLSEAEKLKMETIAVSSISSGIYGCPHDLCSIQYAKAVVDYSSCAKSLLKEIHFVDTNMEMVQIMHKTFQSMIPNEHIPKSYDKMIHVKSRGSSNTDKESSSRDNAQHTAAKANSGLVHYPYCHRDYPPEHSKKEFACCFGPGQNLYIYTADILQLTGIDMIACGNTPTGKTQGYLANAIKDRGGTTYNTELNKAFKNKCAAGKAVVCYGGGLKNFKWVTHAILYLKKQCKGDYESKVTSSLQNIFIAMKTKSCNSIALPLVGTGKGNADPAFYGQRFFEALDNFASFNKSYVFKVHLVHFSKDQTEKAIETIRGACKNAHPQLRRPKHGTYLVGSTSQLNGARPKSAYPTPRNDFHNKPGNQPRNKFQDRPGKDLKQNRRHSESMRIPENKRQKENWEPAGNKSPQGDCWKPMENMTAKYENTMTATKTGAKSLYTSSNGNTDMDISESAYTDGKNKYKRTHHEESGRRNEESGGTNKASGGTSKESGRINEEHDGTNEESSRTNEESGGTTEQIFLQESMCKVNADSKSDSSVFMEKSQKQTGGNLRIFEDNQEKKSSDIPKVEKSEDNAYNDDAMNEDEVGSKDEFEEMDVDDDEDEEEEVYDDAPSEFVPDGEEDNGEEEVETCVICMDDISNPKKLSCGHVFCTECIQAQFTYKEACPTCGKVCGIITGDQPSGDMNVFINDRASCAGFEGCGRIEITYRFPDGTQGPTHPRPNARFKGITRKAYLPNNRRGQEICEMLKVAFDRKLVFTIGNSRTTGAEGVITWNDIHHKTDQKPNTQFGYPDPTYLDRVTDELKIKGVTVDDIPALSAHRSRRR